MYGPLARAFSSPLFHFLPLSLSLCVCVCVCARVSACMSRFFSLPLSVCLCLSLPLSLSLSVPEQALLPATPCLFGPGFQGARTANSVPVECQSHSVSQRPLDVTHAQQQQICSQPSQHSSHERVPRTRPAAQLPLAQAWTEGKGSRHGHGCTRQCDGFQARLATAKHIWSCPVRHPSGLRWLQLSLHRAHVSAAHFWGAPSDVEHSCAKIQGLVTRRRTSAGSGWRRLVMDIGECVEEQQERGSCWGDLGTGAGPKHKAGCVCPNRGSGSGTESAAGYGNRNYQALCHWPVARRPQSVEGACSMLSAGAEQGRAGQGLQGNAIQVSPHSPTHQ